MKSLPRFAAPLFLATLFSIVGSNSMAKNSLVYIATQNPEKMGITLATFDDATGTLSAPAMAIETRDPAHVQPLRVGGVARTYARLIGDSRLLLPVLAGAFGMGGMFAYISGSPFVLMGLYGLSEQQYAMVFGLNAFGLIAASQLNGWWLRRLCPNEALQRSYWIPAAAGLALLGLGLHGSDGSREDWAERRILAR